MAALKPKAYKCVRTSTVVKHMQSIIKAVCYVGMFCRDGMMCEPLLSM